MLKRILNRLKEKCGAATIEAVVAFTGFLFVIITILNVANYCRVQMIISNAVDAAARELSQYSYFYNMTGMQKFNNYVNENAGIGAANINDVIDGTNSVYTTLSGALSDTTDYGNQLADKIDNQNLTYQDIQTAVLKLDTNSTNIMSSITTMEAKFSSVERNPLLYMKSLAAVAGGEALDLAKSYVIAAPLAKLFTSVNINSGDTSVQQYLENLGIVGGFDGLNFNTSTIFTASAPDEIHIRCYYKISLCNFVDKSLFEIPICKEAVCRAWLGGDDNPVKVSAQAAVPAPEDDGTRSMPEQADADVSGGEVADGDVSGGEGGIVGADDEKRNSDDEFLMLVATINDNSSTQEEKEEAFRKYAEALNAEGGIGYEGAVDLLEMAYKYDISIGDLNLFNTTGEVWKEDALIVEAGKNANGYEDFQRFARIFNSSPSLSLADKYDKLEQYYQAMGTKTDIMMPADWTYINGISDKGDLIINWPGNLGFYEAQYDNRKEFNCQPVSPDDPSTFLPENWDRYGRVGNGYNFSDLQEPKYTMAERALPYEENESAYHSGKIDTNRYFDIIDAIKDPGTSIKDVNAVLAGYGHAAIDENTYDKLVEGYCKYLDDIKKISPDFDAPYGVTGYAASAFDCSGGARQYTTPIPLGMMIELGIAEEN